MTDWQIGDRIKNRWDIYRILRGGMGEVYIVYDHEFREAFAAKTFQDEVFTRNPQVAGRFTQEALTWVNLDVHQNVTQARFVHNIEGKPYLFLEYISGGDLSSWIGTPRLTEDLPQVLRFAIQCCAGMTHALSKGIKVHRDIKPQNCLITSDKTLKVTDFGLAKAFDVSDMGTGVSADLLGGGFLGRLFGRPPVEESIRNVDDITSNSSHMGTAMDSTEEIKGDLRSDLSVTFRGNLESQEMVTSSLVNSVKTRSSKVDQDRPVTHTGVAAGTCTHMAPEQFEDAKHVDVRSDIYSFGVMLYQMAAGKLPFEGRSWQEFERLHKTQSVPALDHQPSELSRIVQRCLAKDPADRCRDFGEVRDGLVQMYERLAGEEAPQPVRGAALSAAHWSNKGVSLTNLGRHEEALTCFENALKIKPRYAEALLNKGVTLGHLGRHQEALDCYERVLEISPRDDRAWSNKGNALGELGRLEEALSCYERAIEIKPHDEAAWLSKGLELIELGRLEEALACCARAAEINPRNEKSWTNKGLALYGLGRLEEALDCYERALTINPRAKKAWTDKGLALDKLGRHKEALDCHKRALAIDPRFAEGWSNKGVMLVESGQEKEALDCFVRATEINPRYIQAWTNRGLTLSRLGRYQEALSCYDHALEINPSLARAWTNKGVVREATGEYKEALVCFARALKIDPHDEHACFNAGAVLLNNFQLYREALACFEEAHQLGHPQAAQAIALCQKNLDR
jgi:tetratricopeptide (TPR) repeat protein